MRTRSIILTACLAPFCLFADNPPSGVSNDNSMPTMDDSTVIPRSDKSTLCDGGHENDPSCETSIYRKVQRGSEVALAGQMVMMQLQPMLDKGQLQPEYAKLYAKKNIGVIFDAPGAIGNGKYDYTVKEWRELYTKIQQAFKDESADPVLLGIDAVHGLNYATDAVFLPCQASMGATFNRELVYKGGVVAGEESLAAGAALLFFPVLDLAVDKNWPRIQETFSESSFVVGELGAAAVRGVQSTNKTSACIKHFVAYSKNRGGFDRSNVDVSNLDLKNKYLPPYKKAIDAGAKCVMESYISINRSPVISSTVLLNDILRDKLGFKGLLISDYREVDNLVDWHHTAATTYDASKLALNTSLDMNMEATSSFYIVNVYKAIRDKVVTMKRLEDSYQRISALKKDLGLYDELVPGAEYLNKVQSAEHVETALNIARESMVLYKNNNSILPLKKETKVFLTGPAANDRGLQCGSWTLQWQGVKESNENFPNVISFEAGLKAQGGNVVSAPGIYVNGTKISGQDNVKEMAAASDVIIMTLAEEPGTEKPADEYDLKFNSGQLEYARELLKTGKPMILVLVINRPRLLDGLADEVDAILNTLLPCQMGGQAFAEILYGAVSPSGKSPYTYPAYQSVSDVMFDDPIDDKCVGYQPCETQFDFGSGLSYVNITYGSIKLSSNQIKKDDILTVSVELTNLGSMVAKEAVLLYLVQPFRAIATPEYQTLQAFEKVELQPNVPQVVKFQLNSDAWTVFSPDILTDFEKKFEASKFFVTFKANNNCNDGSPDNECVSFTVS